MVDSARSSAKRIGITGHQGMPDNTRELVRAALLEILTPYAPGLVGVTCLADGADQLFARVVLSLGGKLEVIVPADEYRDSLAPAAQVEYDDLIDRASHVEHLPFFASTEEAHMAGGQAVVDHSDILVAIWDGLPARGLGGTADVVAYAKRYGVPVEVVWPPGSSRS